MRKRLILRLAHWLIQEMKNTPSDKYPLFQFSLFDEFNMELAEKLNPKREPQTKTEKEYWQARYKDRLNEEYGKLGQKGES
jgi:hypothetical protein